MSVLDQKPTGLAVLMKNKLVLVGVGAVGLLVATTALALNRPHQPPQAPPPAQQPAPANVMAPKPIGPPLLSKVPEFWSLAAANLPVKDMLVSFSPTWKRSLEEIDRKVASITDESLREVQRRQLTEKLDRIGCEREATANYKVANTSYMEKRQAFLEAHKDHWIELGTFYSYDPTLQRIGFMPSKAAPPLMNLRMISGVITLQIGIPEADAAFSKFKAIELHAITERNRASWAEINSRMNPRAYYENNGVDPSQVDEMMAEEERKIWAKAENEIRSQGLLLVAQGDYAKGSITKIALMAYSTQELLFEFPPESTLPAK